MSQKRVKGEDPRVAFSLLIESQRTYLPLEKVLELFDEESQPEILQRITAIGNVHGVQISDRQGKELDSMYSILDEVLERALAELKAIIEMPVIEALQKIPFELSSGEVAKKVGWGLPSRHLQILDGLSSILGADPDSRTVQNAIGHMLYMAGKLGKAYSPIEIAKQEIRELISGIAKDWQDDLDEYIGQKLADYDFEKEMRDALNDHVEDYMDELLRFMISAKTLENVSDFSEVTPHTKRELVVLFKKIVNP